MLVETLEGRQLFAVTAPVLAGTELRVFGDAGNNVIRVLQQDAATVRVEVDGQVFQFVDANVNTLRLNVSPTDLTHGTAGNDRVEVVSSAALPLTENAQLFGGIGNDTLIGGDGNDALKGEDGNDVMSGNKGNDNLDGGLGDNTLSGGDGDDAMTAGIGKDVFDGGAGADTVSYTDRTAGVNVSLDNAANDGQLVIKVVAGKLTLASEADNVKDTVENVNGGAGNDIITASAAAVNNVFNGGAGNDKLDGKAGNDSLSGQAGNDTLIGGDGNDLLSAGDGNDTVSGGKGDDSCNGDAGDDIITGGLGRDAMRGGAGNDFIFAQDGQIDGVIDGGAGFDTLDRDDADPAASLIEQIL